MQMKRVEVNQQRTCRIQDPESLLSNRRRQLTRTSLEGNKSGRKQFSLGLDNRQVKCNRNQMKDKKLEKN